METTKITGLKVANIKRIEVAEINPEGNMIVIGGENGQGKSSLIDSIEYAFGGKAGIPSQALRKGTKKGVIIADLDNGMTVKREITSKGKNMLTVTKDGRPINGPQQILNELYGHFTFDPLAFSRSRPKEQVEILKKLLGLDFSKHDINRKSAYDQRTEHNHDVNQLKGQIAGMTKHEAPDEEISIEGLTEELKAGEEKNKANDGTRNLVSCTADIISSLHATIEANQKKIQQLVSEQETFKADLARETETHITLTKEVEALTDIDLDAIRTNINEADATNRMVRENANIAELAKRIKALSTASESCSNRIIAIDEAKLNEIEKAEFPIEGMSLDDEGVMIDGIYLTEETLSSAECLRASVAIAIWEHSTLYIALIRDGSLLDKKSMAMISEMVNKAGMQLWVEVVGDREDCAVVFEDGKIKKAVKKDE